MKPRYAPPLALLALATLAMLGACATTKQPGGLKAPPAFELRVLETAAAPPREASALAEKLYAGATLTEVQRELGPLLARSVPAVTAGGSHGGLHIRAGFDH